MSPRITGRIEIKFSLKDVYIMSNPIPFNPIEVRLKKILRIHLKELGFHNDGNQLILQDKSKDTIRQLHHAQLMERLNKQKIFIRKEWPKLSQHFANGQDVNVNLIEPYLETVKANTWQSRLFRLASLTWSIPVSYGYGRRIRFLVWDRNNHKLIGLIALGDPVFNLKVRDDLIGWTAKDREERLVNILDAYVLGALPPYNLLLGGKLVACLIRSREVIDIFNQKYGNTVGVISQKAKKAALVTVTTTSALGKSSVYNRLSLNGINYFKSIGFTNGWGHFHIPEAVFRLMREYLEQNGHKYSGNHQFGEGPNWRIRAIRETLRMLGMNQNLLRHGIQREVFSCDLAENSRNVLRGFNTIPDYSSLLSMNEIVNLAKKRWLIPRAERINNNELSLSYQNWDKEQLIEKLMKHQVSYESSKSKLELQCR